MNPAPNREESLFQAAAQLSRSERSAFLDQECPDDIVLRQRLEALLAAHDVTDSFMAEPTAPVHPIQNRLFGGYELLEQIAVGGMGVVYRARHLALNRTVALKMVLGGHLASSAVVQRFKTEAEAAARLDHPHIAPIYEVGEREGQPFFTMKFLEGGTLAQKIAEHQLRRPEACKGKECPEKGGIDRPVQKHDSKVLNNEKQRHIARFMATVAHAVHHAHQRGILHRDLKPGNILLDSKGEPQVTDFGLAKLLEGESNLTQTDAVMGTPSYMAPEQASGQTKQLATPADIYSLGAILYELLAGQPPFSAGSAVEIMRQVVEQAPQSPRALNPQVDRDLETICLKCLEKEPGRRYDSALALSEDLDRWLQSQPILARPSSTFERTIKWVKRKPATATLFGVIGLALVLGLVGLVVSNALITKEQAEIKKVNNRLNQEQAETRAALERETQALAELTRANESLEEALRREEKIAYFRGIALARQEWMADNIRRADQILEECGPVELRGWEWRYLKRLCKDPGFLTFEGNLGSGASHTISYLQNRTPVAWVVQEGRIKLLDATTGTQIFSYSTNQGDVCFALSPTGSFLATARNGNFKDSTTGEITLWDTSNGLEIRKFAVPALRAIHSLTFSPEGERLAAGVTISQLDGPNGWRAVGGEVLLWNSGTGEPLPSIARQTNSFRRIVFSPDGRLLATPNFHSVRIWKRTTGEQILDLPAHPGPNATMEFSPDGQHLAVPGAVDSCVRLFNPSTGQESRAFFGHAKSLSSIGYSSDGKMFAAGSSSGAVRVWDTATGQQIHIFRHASDIAGVAFSADNKRLVVSRRFPGQRNECTVWDLSSPQEVQALETHRGQAWTVTFSRDGQLLASTSDDHTVTIWDVASRQPRLILRGHTGPVYGAAFSPDTKLIASASKDGTVKVWNTQDGKTLLSLSGHGGWVHTVVFSPDGQRLASASQDGTVKIWDALTGQTMLNFAGHNPHEKSDPDLQAKNRGFVTTVVFSPDGARVASAGYDATVRVWDAANGKEFLLLQHVGDVYSVAFSADGKHLASSTSNGEVKVWDAETGKDLNSLKGLVGVVESVAFSPDGERLATTSRGSVKLWDTDSGYEIMTLDGADNAVVFSPEGRLLVSARRNGTVRVWDGATSRLVEAREAFLRARIPPRQPDIDANLIDLSSHYNAALNENWHFGGISLSSLPTGVQKMAGVNFDVRGLIQAGAKSGLGEEYPKQISGIKVARPAARVHFLHAAIYASDAKENTRIGAYVVHYANRQRQAIPILIGRDLADWWEQENEGETKFEVAWTGSSHPGRSEGKIRLFKSTWENPYPELEVKSIDFESSDHVTAPFLVAITVN